MRQEGMTRWCGRHTPPRALQQLLPQLILQQRDLAPEGLAKLLLNMERSTLLDKALKAKNMQKINATREVVTACEELA